MKKLLSVIFSTLQEGLKGGLLFLALIVSTSAIYASDTQVDGIWYDFNRNTKTASVTYKGSFDYDYPNEYSGEVTIPETVTYYGTTYSVTSIGDEAFYGCSSLTSVTIPNSVTSIGDDAFYNCSSLTSVTIGNSVTSIGDWTFYSCSSLTSISIPNSVTSIGWYAFGGCSSLTSVTIGESVTSIGYQAFYECTSLTSITITNSVTSIGDEAFRYCSSLTSVTIGNSVTIIGSSAFNGCSSLTSITIPNSVTSLGRGAFYKCSSLTSVTIGNSVTNIGEEAFYGCSKLTSVTINSDAIVNKAYSSSSNISDIFGSQVTKCIIGDEVTGIGNYAFSYCSKLTSVTLPNSVTSIGEGAFSGCSALTSVTIPNSVTSIADYAFLGCSSLTSVTVGNSVTSIGEGAFSFCSSLTSITIPNSVTSIGYQAFYNCSSLTSIIVEKGNSIYDSRENCNAIIETAINTLIAGCQNTTIPNSVTSIGSSAFGGHSSLTSITIPNSVTSIGDDAFRYCSSLTSVTIGNSVTSIGVSAFYGCRSLKSITIPNSVTNIGGWAFSECSALTSVTIPNSVTSIEDYAFSWCSSLTSITIPNSVTSIGSSAFSWCSQVTMQGTTPPSIAANTFNNNATIFVPCSAMDAYLATPVWQFLDLHGLKYNVYLTAIEGGSAKITAAGCESNSVTIEATPNFGYHFVQWSDGNTDNPRSLILTQDTTFTAEFAPNQYTVTTLASHSERGTTQGDTTVNYLDFITISAAANYGYHFTQWNDGKTDNPRQVQVTKDTIYTAYFDKNTYYITKNYDSNQGYINGSSSGEYLDNITLTATPNYGYHFTQWSDGNTENPRSLILTQDTTFTAEFASNQYTITTTSSQPDRGTTQGDTTVNYREYTTISADANYGYHFENWNDGNADNPRRVQVRRDETYTAYFEKDTYSVTTNYNSEQGYIDGVSSAKYLDMVTLTAIPKLGYEFVRWSDSNTANPRTFTLTQDTAFTAEFAQSFSGRCGNNLYWAYNKSDQSIAITGTGDMYNYTSGTQPWLLFKEDIKEVTVANTATSIGTSAFEDCSKLTSIIIPNSVTSIGNSAFRNCSSLTSVTIPNSVTSIGYAAFRGCSGLTSVTIPNSVTSIGDGAFYGCSSLTSVTIGEGVTSIGEGAFYGCSSLTSITWEAENVFEYSEVSDVPFYDIRSQITEFVFGNKVQRIPAYFCYEMEKITSLTIPNSVKTIGTSAFEGCARLGKISLGTGLEKIAVNAFSGCTRLYDIYTYATYPPFADKSSFANYNVYVYVPCEYQRGYTLDVVWGKFKFIECIDSEDATTDGNVAVDPGITDVTITWPTEGNADTYTIIIKRGSEVFCTLTFNADGQLLNIAFAPSRDGKNHPAQYAVQTVSGYRFTVTGLEEGTHYTYNIDVRDIANKTIKSYTGEFTTESMTAVENTHSQSATTSNQKILRDGQLLILRDDKTYNIVGQIVE